MLNQYKLALDALEKVYRGDRIPVSGDSDTHSEPTEIGDRSVLEQAVLDLLTARDAVQVCLEDAACRAAADLIELRQLDRRLCSHRLSIVRAIQLEEWRSLLQPPERSWWWYLEPPALLPCLERRYRWLDQLDWLWAFTSLFFLTLAVTVVLDTLNRVAGEGLNTQGMFPVVVQVLLTLAGGSAALTDGGRRVLKGIMARLRIPQHFWQEFGAIASLMVLLIVGGIYAGYLPQLAATRFQQGTEAYQSGQFDSALQAYQQTLALQPGLIEAHYHLGLIYEDLQRTDEAIAEYQLVVRSNPADLDKLTWIRAHNNLGRLYLLAEQYAMAWVPLERALATIQPADLSAPDMQREQYTLRKNLGWLWVQQGQFAEAEEFLAPAIAQAPERAAAHCLQAQVLEGLERQEEAIASWVRCLGGDRQIQAEEAAWAAIAREKVEGAIP